MGDERRISGSVELGQMHGIGKAGKGMEKVLTAVISTVLGKYTHDNPRIPTSNVSSPQTTTS